MTDTAPSTPSAVLPCGVCGDSVVVPGELLKNLPRGVTLQITCAKHDVPVAGRKYEARVNVYRVDDMDAGDGETLLSAFTARAEAGSLLEALSALSGDLSAKWEKFQEVADVCEQDDAPPPPTG